MQVIEFSAYWITNTIVIGIVSSLVPRDVVLGNQHIAPFWASILSGFIFATFMILVKPTIEMTIHSLEKQHVWGLVVLSNVVGVWILTRVALLAGLGITAFFWAFVLGGAITLGQWAVIEGISSRSKGPKRKR